MMMAWIDGEVPVIPVSSLLVFLSRPSLNIITLLSFPDLALAKRTIL